VARCSNEEARREIFDESIMSGADKFAKDSVILQLFFEVFFLLFVLVLRETKILEGGSGADKFAKHSVIFNVF
jgi:hypothetical protein